MQVTLSIRAVPGLSKMERAPIKCYEKFISCDFRYLLNILSKDYIFSPFNYIGYTQNTSNICSDAMFVVIDVDSTSISMGQRLLQLEEEGLQCILATTSDAFNWHKYRILLPLDRPVNAFEYRCVIHGIRDNKLITDFDPVSSRPAQKFYSYADATVLHSFIGGPLCVDDYMVQPSTPEYRATSPTTDITELLPEFESYRHAIKGKRTRSLISAGYKCLEYGLSDSQLEQVIYYINSLFLVPKPVEEIQRRVLNFIKSQRNRT